MNLETAKADVFRVNPLRALIWIGFLIASISLFRSTVGQATDFEVFWRVGQALQQRQPIYEIGPAAGMVFKYPPWIALFFYPLGWMDFATAKILWAGVQIASLYSILWSLWKICRTSDVWIALLFALFWGIWVIHFLDGQIMLTLLAVFLYFLRRPALDASARGLMPVVLSAKVFTLFPLLPVLDRFNDKRAKYSVIMLGIALTAGAAMLSYQGHVDQMMHAWTQSAASGATQLLQGQTRGAKNQSIVSFICRLTDIPAQATGAEVMISLSLFALSFLLVRWRRTARASTRWGDLNFVDEVFCFLALTAPLHPLPWHHLYVWTFPLVVARFNSDRYRPTYWTAIFLLCLSSARGLPIAGIGDFLELNVGRAWGALLLVAQTLFARHPRTAG